MVRTSGLAIYKFFWGIWGREIFEIKNQSTLVICLQIFHRKPKDEYSLDQIRDLRVSVDRQSIIYRINFWCLLNPKRGNIAFDYGAKTYRFGEDIDEAEAKQIIAVLQEYIS